MLRTADEQIRNIEARQKNREGRRSAKRIRLPRAVRHDRSAECLGDPIAAQLPVAHLNLGRDQAGFGLRDAGPRKGDLPVLN